MPGVLHSGAGVHLFPGSHWELPILWGLNGRSGGRFSQRWLDGLPERFFISHISISYSSKFYHDEASEYNKLHFLVINYSPPWEGIFLD